jgi:hypothetical protein
MTTPTATKTTRVFIDIRLLLHNVGTVPPKAGRVTGARRSAGYAAPPINARRAAALMCGAGKSARAENGARSHQPVEGAPAETSPFVFVSERGSPFTTAGFARMIERVAAAAGLELKAHPHMLRHACGHALANKATTPGQSRHDSAIVNH